MHIWPLEPFIHDYGLALTPLMLCALILYLRRDIQFNADSEQQILKKNFMAGLFALRIFATKLLRGNLRRIFFYY